jgi:hypothetical protein
MLPLGSLALSVHLSSTGSRLLLLLMILLLLEEEHNTWLWCSGPQLDCWDGQKCQSALRRWRGGDGDNWGHHVAPSRAGETRARPSARGSVALIGGFLEDRCKDNDPLCTITTNMMPGSFPSGERLRLPKRSVVNSMLPKQMVSPEVSLTLVRLLLLAMKVSFGE